MAISFTKVLNPLEGLEKLRISTLSDPKDEKGKTTYIVMYNPSEYSQEYKMNFDIANPSGNEGVPVYKYTAPGTLTLEFLFDATGASTSPKTKPKGSDVGSVVDLTDSLSEGTTYDAIKLFLSEFISINGEEHKPRAALVVWGTLKFKGVMETATVTHSLFASNGKPIRSKVNCTFRSFKSLEEQAAEAKKNSPDLTRYNLVKGEDTLPLLSYDTYKDPGFYLELARVNRLNNFRALRVGSKLRLPPIQK